MPKKIRGRPFERGNPGRPRGAKNRVTRLAEELVENGAEELVQKAYDLALGGDVRCLQFFLDRLLPRRKGRPIDLPLPAIRSMQDITTAMAAIVTGVNDGRLTAEEAGDLMNVYSACTKMVETHDLAVRVNALEERRKNDP